ncbi:MAG: hypothetical protein RSB96_00470 [Oscillospiraceae bacterium]
MKDLKEAEVLFSSFLESNVCDTIEIEMFEHTQDVCKETFWKIARTVYIKGYQDAISNHNQANDSGHLILVKNS